MSGKWRDRLLYLISPIGLLLLWQLLLMAGIGDRRFVPAPSDIAARYWQMVMSGELAWHVSVTLYRVVTIKQAGPLHVAIDGGMGDNLEHSLYGQRFAPLVVGRWEEPAVMADLVGRHCEAGDIVTPQVWLNSPQIGDLIVVFQSGAYGFTSSPHRFLSHPEPQELLL